MVKAFVSSAPYICKSSRKAKNDVCQRKNANFLTGWWARLALRTICVLRIHPVDTFSDRLDEKYPVTQFFQSHLFWSNIPIETESIAWLGLLCHWVSEKNFICFITETRCILLSGNYFCCSFVVWHKLWITWVRIWLSHGKSIPGEQWEKNDLSRSSFYKKSPTPTLITDNQQ